eukprot:GFUD01035446.1.p1 GENE.GFUD01035446.1~~GFUD01035446.1.p1  ORF type:complete len:179 (-),score=31.23 GFUD01035446.1:58-546(-)
MGYSLLIFNTDKDIENSLSFIEEQHKRRVFRNRKRTIFAILFILFIIAMAALVGFGHYRKHLFVQGLEEFSCPEEDISCSILLCPHGMVWSQDEGECHLPAGYQCCQDRSSVFTCYNYNEEDQKTKLCSVKTVISGVAPVPRTFCRPGFVWVPWRRRCFRSS